MIQALVAKHLPGQPETLENMGKALFLERHHWDNFETAIANGIAKAFKG